jgi:transcriptional regulator with XRE-family HTH domain
MNESSEEARRQFAERVVRLQRDQGLSDEELAARAKLGPDELDAVLTGKSRVSLDVIFLLAGALGVEPGELLDRID